MNATSNRPLRNLAVVAALYVLASAIAGWPL